jgi:hypothetical protein
MVFNNGLTMFLSLTGKVSNELKPDTLAYYSRQKKKKEKKRNSIPLPWLNKKTLGFKLLRPRYSQRDHTACS